MANVMSWEYEPGHRRYILFIPSQYLSYNLGNRDSCKLILRYGVLPGGIRWKTVNF